MVKRLFNFWRRETNGSGKPDTWPLCRIRHAALHPGACLWTPGAAGGSLGGGASAALEEVGIGGTVAVGFQTTAREQVHSHGVLARVEAREAFPDGTDPMGLGASHRYQLVALSRIQLDPDSCTNKKIPSIAATSAANRLEDFADPPEPLVEVLNALAALDNAWQPHWADAFAQLPRQPLGQWATTLGWRLAPDERLELFDHPERIADRLLQTLEALHLGLAPEKRRTAVRAQTLTRRTTVMPHRWLAVDADDNGWALFHPSDLATRLTASNPALGQIRDTQQLQAVAGMANTIQCQVQGPGKVWVLLSHTGLELPLPRAEVSETKNEPPTTAPTTRPTRRPILTPAEGITVPIHRILVRHGRLFLGPAGLLQAGQSDRLEYLQGDQWVDVPNGLFRAAIWPILPPDLDRWLHAFPDQALNPPDGLVNRPPHEDVAVFAAILEPIEFADTALAPDDSAVSA